MRKNLRVLSLELFGQHVRVEKCRVHDYGRSRVRLAPVFAIASIVSISSVVISIHTFPDPALDRWRDIETMGADMERKPNGTDS